jgi:Zn-finger nucleic acid-binding protein
MPFCTSCSAPLPQNTPVCEYCGVKNDINFQGIHEYTVVKPETERICPLCDIPMETIDVNATDEHFYIERCPQCMGLFFDPNELNALLDNTVNNVYEIDRKKLFAIKRLEGNLPQRKRFYIKCPVCHQLMNQTKFGLRSGVIIDRCSHGIWLDNGEFRKILEWRKAGGQLFHEKVKYEQEQRKKREQTDTAVFASAHVVNSWSNENEISIGPLIGSVTKAIWRLFS